MRRVYLVTSGDGRESANAVCWPAQRRLEERLTEVFARFGAELVRAFPVDPTRGHGFIRSQRMGMDIFQGVPPDAPLVVAIAAWQFSHHVLPGLRTHRGPILTAGNWSGEWPGLVGLLNLNGSLAKAGVAYSTIWSEEYADEFALGAVKRWLDTGRVDHDESHVRSLAAVTLPGAAADLGRRTARALRDRKAILGVFDEGCMGMYNAVIDDEKLNPLGVYKERLSQSALLAEMKLVTDAEAEAVLDWLRARGMRFVTGTNEATELTERQLLDQARMYVAALRIADRFGCDAVGIQYQNGLTDMAPASDLVEGLLNNPDRPPVMSRDGARELYAGQALPHFNEVDEGAAVDALITNRVWTELGYDPSTTLHDVRWGADWPAGEFVWLLMISGAAPASHFAGGYAAASSERQPAMYFPQGGGTLKGVSRPGHVVWSRVYSAGGALHVDMGLGEAVELPAEETERRWRATDPTWPLMHLRTLGVSRDQFMGRHKANHIQVAYAPDAAGATRALAAKAAAFDELGVNVHLCGTTGLA